MKVISIWNPKGGQGKSLLSINLAAAAVQLDLKPLVICRDPQGTAILFDKKGNLPFDVAPNYPKDRPDYDLIIVDHVAADWDIPPSPVVVVPTKPVRTDYATFLDGVALLEENNKQIIRVVTDGNMSRKGEREMIMAMRRAGAFEVRSSVAFSKAAEEYRTIYDPKLDKAHNVNDRRRELEAILTAVLNPQLATSETQTEERIAANA